MIPIIPPSAFFGTELAAWYAFRGVQTLLVTGAVTSGCVRARSEQTVGLILPRNAAQQAKATEVIDKQDLQPGDLVFFNTMRRTFSHVGIYVGEGKFIHAPRSGSQVRVESMDESYWRLRFNGARRVTPEALARQ